MDILYFRCRGEVKSMSSFAPAAAMFYTDLETLRGLWNPADYGSGIQYAGGISNSLFPDVNIGIQVSNECIINLRLNKNESRLAIMIV